MSNQLLMDFDAPPSNHTATSRAAAESMREAAPTLRARVFAFIVDQPDGATREEIEIGLGMSGNTVRPRCDELLRRGVLYEQGSRPTRSGRLAMVLRAKP